MRKRECRNCGEKSWVAWRWRWCEDCWRMIGKAYAGPFAAGVAIELARRTFLFVSEWLSAIGWTQ